MKRGSMENPESTAPKGTLPSLKYFLLGIAPWAVAAIVGGLRLIESFNPVAMILTIMMLLVTPFAFAMGVQRARGEKEYRGLRPHVSRWLNLVGLGISLGVFVLFAVMSILGGT